MPRLQVRRVSSPSDMIHATSFNGTAPLLYFHLNIAKIIQSLNLTDAIIDDSNSMEHVALQIHIPCRQFRPDRSPAMPPYYSVSYFP